MISYGIVACCHSNRVTCRLSDKVRMTKGIKQHVSNYTSTNRINHTITITVDYTEHSTSPELYFFYKRSDNYYVERI